MLGLLFAAWGSRLLIAQLSTYRDVVTLDVPLDWRVLVFTAGVTIADGARVSASRRRYAPRAWIRMTR